MKSDRRKKVLEEAWIGDAVLSLYARSHILSTEGAVNSDALERMTSNRFLTALGEPASVEAQIGRAYEKGGLAGAFAWIEETLMPVFRAQDAKRLRARPIDKPVA